MSNDQDSSGSAPPSRRTAEADGTRRPVLRRPILAAAATLLSCALAFALWPRRAEVPSAGQPQASGNERPIVPPATSAPARYLLAASALPKGAKVRQEEVGTLDLAGQLTTEGRTVPMSTAVKTQEVWEREVLEADDAGPLKIRLAFVIATASSIVRSGAQALPEETVPHPLQGRVVVAEKVDGRWRVRLEGEGQGAAPTPEQQRKLDQLYFGTDEPCPAAEVPIGHTWEVEGPALRTLLDEREATSLAGRVKMKFERVTQHGGELCAELSLVGDVTGAVTDPQGDQFNYRMGVQGTVLRSLKDRLDVSVDLVGTMDASGQGVRETTTWYWATKGQAVEMKVAGPFKRSRTQKLTLPTRD